MNFRQYVALLFGRHESHAAFVKAKIADGTVVDLSEDVDDRVTDAEDVIFFCGHCVEFQILVRVGSNFQAVII